jgi:thiamine-monophosphate kinase
MTDERELIAQLLQRLPPPGTRLRVASGDDAAVTETTGSAAATTIDAIVEGVHFTLPEFPLEAVGRKALAASLSDLAAMGAEPGEAYVALTAPESLGADELLRIGDGIAAVADRDGILVAGGDVSRGSILVVSVASVGYEPEGSVLVTRAGASAGETVVVTGGLGGGAAALRLLRGDARGAEGALSGEEQVAVLNHQLDPRPRFEAGMALAAAGATAMIDVSDGLGVDLGHVARASAVAITVDLGRVPLADGVAAVAGDADAAIGLAIEGGEDFELLASLPPNRLEEATEAVERAGSQLTAIGEVTDGEAGAVTDGSGNRIEERGFDHIRGSDPGSGSGSGSGSGTGPSGSGSGPGPSGSG